MEDWLISALGKFETQNEALAPETDALFAQVMLAPGLHARFINTLSLLEHLGSHKIMATQHSLGIDQATLKHVAEEAHHAYFMKRQAEKAAERPLDYSPQTLLAPSAARMYFQRLEAVMVRVLSRPHGLKQVYLYMSLVVEFRALWFYKRYQQALQRASYRLSLKRLLGEEQSHLSQMVEQLNAEQELDAGRADVLLAIEEKLYGRLLRAMRSAAVDHA